MDNNNNISWVYEGEGKNIIFGVYTEVGRLIYSNNENIFPYKRPQVGFKPGTYDMPYISSEILHSALENSATTASYQSLFNATTILPLKLRS